MTRTHILLALALAAVAVLVFGQKATIPDKCANLDLNHPVPAECNAGYCGSYGDGLSACGKVTVHLIPRPKNGQCPVCGAMAKPYYVTKGEEHFNMGMANSRRVDCAYCNATFRQWAEGKEPKQ